MHSFLCHPTLFLQAYHEYMPIRSPNSSVPSAGNSSSFVYGNASSGSSSGANDSAVCGGLADIYRTFQFGRTMTLVSTCVCVCCSTCVIAVLQLQITSAIKLWQYWLKRRVVIQ